MQTSTDVSQREISAILINNNKLTIQKPNCRKKGQTGVYNNETSRNVWKKSLGHHQSQGQETEYLGKENVLPKRDDNTWHIKRTNTLLIYIRSHALRK